VHFGDAALRVKCHAGFTVGGSAGGLTSFYMSCEADGTFTNTAKQCLKPKYPVSGEATDAQDGDVKLEEVKLVFTQNGTVVATAFTNYIGRYSVSLGEGTYDVSSTKAGYIELISTLTVTGPISVGGAADVALRKMLEPGSWSAIVTWGPHSADIDSHSFFGAGYATHVYWPSSKRHFSAAGTGGITVDLDRDDVNGFGPETTTFMNVGKCSAAQRGACLIKFKVKNYTPQDGDLGASSVKIKLYSGLLAGGQGETNYAVPTSVGSKLWHTIFTIDSRTEKVYPGENHEPPYLSTTTKKQNWWATLDYATWAKVSPGYVVTGLYKTGAGQMAKLEEAHAQKVEGVTTAMVAASTVDMNIGGTEAAWAACPANQFLQGLLRTGSLEDRSVEGMQQLKSFQCASITGISAYGACEEMVFASSGYTDCPAGSAVTALHRGPGASADFDKMRCCAFPDGNLLPGPSPVTSSSSSSSSSSSQRRRRSSFHRRRSAGGGSSSFHRRRSAGGGYNRYR